LLAIGVDEGRLEIVPIWLREELFDLDRPIEPPTQPPTVMYSGALGRKQGLDLLVALADELAGAEPVQVVIRGAGPERERIDREAAARANLSVTDLVPEESLQAGLEEATIHLVPQEPEGASFSVPSKLLNILAAGRPVLARTAPGSPIADLAASCPAVHTAETTAEFVSRVRDLLYDTSRLAELGLLGRKHVMANYTKDACLGLVERALLAPAKGTRA
jgi:colanic acid biosynthesis glycosyl transferase WcaI